MASVVDGNGGSRLVVTELGHVKELARQLEVHLGGSSPDLCKHLASQIATIAERSISLLITTSNLVGARKRSAVASPLSDASDAPFIKATKKRYPFHRVSRLRNRNPSLFAEFFEWFHVDLQEDDGQEEA
jgi:hypothetical protein